MSNQSNTSNDKPQTVQEIIREIEQKSEGGGYIYRGERKGNPKVSSKLYRDFEIETEGFDIELVQKEMLVAAKKHTGDLPQDFRVDVITSLKAGGKLTEETEEAIDFEILTEIQHYGGKTNLIDFTRDYFIALFFACDGRYDEDGRVILQKVDAIRDMITQPRNPRHRVIAQKSVFLRPPKGFMEPREDEIIIIPSYLKQRMLEHLRNYHAIFTETIYNDLYGFIRNQDIHGDAYTEFYKGFASENRADEAKTPEGKQQEYEAAIMHYTNAIELKPDLVNIYNNRGNVYADKGELDNAIRDYTTAIQLIQLQPDLASAHNNRGGTYADKGDFENAIKDYNKAIQINPDYAEAYYNRGIAYKKKGELDNAIRDYSEAIELKPDFGEAYNNRSIAYQEKGELDSAINDYNAAIKLQPNDAEAYNNRGNAYQRNGDFDHAIQDYTQAIQLNPDYANPYNNRGNAYQEKGDFDHAIRDYTQAIQLNSDYVGAYNNRGNTYQKKGDLDRAIQDYIQAIRLKPDLPEPYNNRGNAYQEKGDFDHAIRDHTQAIQLNPDYANAHRNRGEAWLCLQEWEKAKVDLTTARDMGMDIIAMFHSTFGNIANFEQITGVQLPEDIAAMLTPTQT